MESSQLAIVVFGIIVSVISYFLKGVMAELKEVQKQSNKNDKDLEVLKTDSNNKHDALNEKYDELMRVIIELTKEIKDLNKRIQ